MFYVKYFQNVDCIKSDVDSNTNTASNMEAL